MDSEGNYNAMEAYNERYFIIKNDVNDNYKILETDNPVQAYEKRLAHQREYAIYDSSTGHWTMELPHWFTQSEYEWKNITVESFTYFKPDGTLDLGTTFHSNTLSDGQFAQYDHMICLANDGIERTFFLDAKDTSIEFWFKDYLTEQNLPENETLTVQKKDSNGNLLYWEELEAPSLVYNPKITTETENQFPAVRPFTRGRIYEHTFTEDTVKKYFYYLWYENDDEITLIEQQDEINDNPIKQKRIYIGEERGLPQQYYKDLKTYKYVKTTKQTELPVFVPAKIPETGQRIYVYYVKYSFFENEENKLNQVDVLIDRNPIVEDIAKKYEQYEGGYEIKSWVAYVQETNENNEPLYWMSVYGDIDESSIDKRIPLVNNINQITGRNYYMNYYSNESIPQIYEDILDDDEQKGSSVMYFTNEYYYIPKNYDFEITPIESAYPVYEHAVDIYGNEYYIKHEATNEDEDPNDHPNFVATSEVTEYPLYTNVMNEYGNKLYYHFYKETTENTGDPVKIDEEYKSCFVIVCKLRF